MTKPHIINQIKNIFREMAAAFMQIICCIIVMGILFIGTAFFANLYDGSGTSLSFVKVVYLSGLVAFAFEFAGVSVLSVYMLFHPLESIKASLKLFAIIPMVIVPFVVIFPIGMICLCFSWILPDSPATSKMVYYVESPTPRNYPPPDKNYSQEDFNDAVNFVKEVKGKDLKEGLEQLRYGK